MVAWKRVSTSLKKSSSSIVSSAVSASSVSYDTCSSREMILGRKNVTARRMIHATWRLLCLMNKYRGRREEEDEYVILSGNFSRHRTSVTRLQSSGATIGWNDLRARNVTGIPWAEIQVSTSENYLTPARWKLNHRLSPVLNIPSRSGNGTMSRTKQILIDARWKIACNS